MIIFGWGRKAKRLANAGINKCPNCHNWTAFGVFSRASSVSLYFVTVAKFSTKFYIVCSTCDAGFEIDEAKKIELLRESVDLPTTEHMIAIWNGIDGAALRLMQGAPKEGERCPTLIEATEALKKTYAPHDVEYVARMYAASLADPDDNQGAIEDYGAAIRLDPNDAWAYSNRGLARSDLGDHKGALADYGEAIRLDPNYAAAYYNRGNAKHALGDYKGAMADYGEAIRLDPTLAAAYYNRGIAKSDLGDNQGAIEDYGAAIRLAPTLVAAYYSKACAYAKANEAEPAVRSLEEAIALDPTCREKAKEDADFHSIREHPSFKALMERGP